MTPPAYPDSGSETETDDELYVSFEEIDEPACEVPTASANAHAASLAVEPVVAAESMEKSSPQLATENTATPTDSIPAVSESDGEDEPPAATVRPTPVSRPAPPHTVRRPSHLPSLALFQSTTPAPVQISTLSTPAMATTQTAPTFVSPFTALASAYQPPPPPIVGAPPASYVPQAMAQRPLSISCQSCMRTLPQNSSPIRLTCHGACACCGRYYLETTLKKREGKLMCDVCHHVPPPSTAHMSYSSHCKLCNNHLKVILPKSVKDTRLCQCCQQYYSRTAFPHFQLTVKDKYRRCGSCVSGTFTPDKFKDAPVHRLTAASQSKAPSAQKNKRPADPATGTLSKAQRKKRRRAERLAQSAASGNNTGQRAAQSAAPGAGTGTGTESVVEFTSALTEKTRKRLLESLSSKTERQEMQIRVRDIKLARRSILRRRQANDLRGSSRIEYNEQLRKEEEALNKKAVKARNSNPSLYDQIDGEMIVKAAKVPSGERDSVGKKKPKQKKQPKKKPVTQLAAKRKAPATPAQPKAKRQQAIPQPTTTASATPATLVAKVHVKTEAVASSSTSRRSSAKIEIIDLVDSD